MTDPRLFAIPLGAPYPAAFADGFLLRFGDRAPEDIARIRIYANTRRMAVAIGDEIARRGPGLLPSIRTVADLGREPAAAALPAPSDPLALRLELTQLTRRLLESDPSLAPADAAFDMAGSLLRLVGEMAGEGVVVSALSDLDLSEHSAHWARSLEFIGLVARYLDLSGGAAEPEAHQRAVTAALIDAWTSHPPKDPVVIAGSTGSRGTTRLLMEAVARATGGHVVLPGFDFALPASVWPTLGEAHPQYRFLALLEALGMEPGTVEVWAGATADPARSRVLSLALRPPPVTDQWRIEGRTLPDLGQALSGVTLVEAPGARTEAVAIALGLRDAVEKGRRAALVSPDRVLTRRVSAALTRWGIEPDDSAGRPLALSAPGRLLRQVADLLAREADADAVLALLKHPLVSTGAERGQHLLLTREFELWLRRGGVPFETHRTLAAWARGHASREAWAAWLAPPLAATAPGARRSVADLLDALLTRTEALAAGPLGGPVDELWAGAPGEKAKAAIDALARAAPHGGNVSPHEFRRILDGVLEEEVRDPVLPHADVMIRGTIEVRALDADLVILAGLNEDVWPPAPEPDPWLNRTLRREAGLLSPERRTGLSAHDFEQGFNSPEIWLSRTLRSDEGETVPSRWLNRLTGLVGGLAVRGGEDALKAMRQRGARWVRLAEGLDRRAQVERPAPRPAPRPPVEVRPRKLSVTAIQTLIRDPYAIYARHVLGLRALPAPLRAADPRLRGTALHRIVERFVKSGLSGDRGTDRAALLAIADDVFSELVPWPVTRALWRARLDRIAGTFLEGEYARQEAGTPVAFEADGRFVLDNPEFTLTGKADRFDQRPEGIAVFDYKSGRVPTPREVQHFDRQLHLEAVMVEAGAFAGIGKAPVTSVAHIGLGSNPEVRAYEAGEPGENGLETGTVLAEFRRLVAAYLEPDRGFASRRAMETVGYEGDYDQLARFGEWDETATPSPEDLT